MKHISIRPNNLFDQARSDNPPPLQSIQNNNVPTVIIFHCKIYISNVTGCFISKSEPLGPRSNSVLSPNKFTNCFTSIVSFEKKEKEKKEKGR